MTEWYAYEILVQFHMEHFVYKIIDKIYIYNFYPIENFFIAN